MHPFYTLIIVCLVLLAVLQPRRSVLALSLLFPLYLVHLQIGPVPTNLFELMLYGATLGFVLHYLLFPLNRPEVKHRLKHFYHEHKGLLWSLVFFLAAAALASVITLDLRKSLGIFKGWFVDPILAATLFYLVARNKFDSYIQISFLSFSSAVLSLYGIWDYFVHQRAIHWRLMSVWSSPNYHALLVGPIILLGLGALMSRKFWSHGIWPVTLALTTLINIVALFYTFSFGGFLAVAGGVLVLLIGSFVNKVGPAKFRWSLGILAVVAIVGLFVYSINTPKFQRDWHNLSGVSSLRARLELWKTSRVILEHHPVSGVGWGNFETVYDQYVLQAIGHAPLELDLIHSHNIFLDFWIDGGILGILSFLVLLIVLFRLTWRARQTDWALTWAVRAALVAVILHGLVDTPYFKNDLSYVFWLMPAMLIVTLLTTRSEQA